MDKNKQVQYLCTPVCIDSYQVQQTLDNPSRTECGPEASGLHATGVVDVWHSTVV